MTTAANLTPKFNSSSVTSLAPLHVFTLTPFFPSDVNPVYGTYVSESNERFAGCNLQSSVIGVSPLYHERRRPLVGSNVTWVRYPQIPGNKGLPSAGTFLYWRLLGLVGKMHRQRRIDVIHAHASLPCGHAALLLAKKLKIPFVVTIHGLDVFNACFEPGTAAAARRAKISAEVYRRAGSVICVSHAIENLLKDGLLQPVRSCVIYNGTDPAVFYPDDVACSAVAASVDGTPTLLIVGNLLHGKGHEVVLKAMAQVKARFPKLQCKIIGEGADRNRFADLARELGISENVFFLGRQDRQSVARAMRACTIFTLPSRFEGLGCAYLEAMACGKPVIACQGQGIGEIVQHGHNGWLIPADGVEQMADGLSQLLGSRDLRTRIGDNARKTITNGLTITDQVRHLNDVYRAVIRP